jgi:hypothetical protein
MSGGGFRRSKIVGHYKALEWPITVCGSNSDYHVPFAFTGTLEKITFDLGETSMTPEAIKAMMEELAKKRDR